jgi:nucleotide-binding universal stress UspA family protein
MIAVAPGRSVGSVHRSQELETAMKILVGIDGGPQQPAALELARRLADNGELVVATVYPVSPMTTRLGAAYHKVTEEAAWDILKAAREELAPRAVETRAIPDLHTARALHDLAVEVGADVIVIGGSHRGGVGRAVLGSTGHSVVHGSPRPVVVAPRDDAGGDGAPLRRIGVAYDGEPESQAALNWAERLAGDAGASLEILTVSQFTPVAMYPGVATYPPETVLEELREESQRRVDAAIERATVPVDGRVLDGPVVSSLAEAAKDLDLLVVGSRGYGPFGSLLMGSVSRAVADKAPCPVVVIPRSAAGSEHRAGSESLAAAE